jgi:hypothetical protein
LHEIDETYNHFVTSRVAKRLGLDGPSSSGLKWLIEGRD